MMPTLQVLSPANGPTTIQVFGRTFTTTAGVPIPVNDNEAAILAANGWIICATGGHGTTANRPVNPAINMRYTDTTLGVVVMFDGKNWIHEVTGGAV